MKGSKGGLCGLAALYQAVENTIMTPSGMTWQDYDTLRTAIAMEMGLSSYSKMPDSELLQLYYNCRFHYDFLFFLSNYLL